MANRRKKSVKTDEVKGTIFSDCIMYVCKANLSLKQYSMLESRIKTNDGSVTSDINLNLLTHIVVEDGLCGDKKFCYNLLKTDGLKTKINCEIVRTEWLYECLNKKIKVDSKSYLVILDDFTLGEEPEIEGEFHREDEELSKKRRRKEDEDSSDEDKQLQSPDRKISKKDFEPDRKYICTQPSTSDGALPKNHLITTELQKLADAFRSRGDQWRAYSYEKAVSAIRNHSKEISSYEEARNLPGIGEGMAKKVMEMVNEGQIRKVAEICDDERTKVLDLFARVWGAGPATAHSWYQQGFRTLEDLRSKAVLTKQQTTGLKYFDEIQDRMTRDEVEQIVDLVKKEALSVNSNMEVVICGSYRRGKETCGDVDVLLIRPDHLCSKDILIAILKELKSIRFISDDLTTLESRGNQHVYLGLCKLPGEGKKHRRLDLFVAPKCESATAVMHYTGSALFNRSIRLLASEKGMSLSRHSLSSGVMRQGTDKFDGIKLHTPTEESIFKHLGLEYRPPEERDH